MGIPGSANPMLFGGAAAYQINQSLRFNSADSTYLNRTPASDTSSNKKGTFSCWMKIGDNSGTNGGTFIGAADNYHYGQFYNQELYFGNASSWVSTAAKHRDPSAWYHVVFAFDTTLATANDRMIIYVNGSRQATGTFNNQPSQNSSFVFLNTTQAYYIGRLLTAYYFNGCIAEVNFIDGTAVTPSSFGETDTITGAWIPKKYSGSYGTNGFYLKFEGSGIGTDSSGNGNTWTANNFSTSGTGTDVMSDTPTNNWCTLNPISSNASLSLSNGNLDTPSTQDNKANNGTIGVSSGKWYWEVTVNSNSKPCPFIGVTSYSQENDPDVSPTINSNAARSVVRLANAFLYKNYTGSSVATGGTNEGTTGTVGIALNFDAGEIKYYRDNTLFHTDTTIPTNGTTLFPYIGVTFSGSGGWQSTSFNFGQRAFAYTPPTGFKALNTTNLPEPTIKKGDKYFDTVLYTGNGSTQTISGLNFSPDFVWFKSRNTTYHHALVDAVRGVDKYLYSSLTIAEETQTTAVSSFNSNGFSFAGNFGNVNNSGTTYAAWAWDANGAGSSNTAGSITSTVSANATAGFSIVTYTGNATAGATVGHGLGVAPKMIICKRRQNNAAGTSNWQTYHASLGATKLLYLNTDTDALTGDSPWNNTAPTSTVFTLGDNPQGNPNGDNVVAYCFSEVAGYSKFGSYTGNGSSDGPFVFCGFRPAWLLIKRTDSTSDWILQDSKRLGYNVDNNDLIPNQNYAEATDDRLDQLSNGFKLRSTFATSNASGGTYVFAAFSETAFKFANAR